MGPDRVIVDGMSALVQQILQANQATEFAVPVAPLTEGRILLGREAEAVRTAPSSILFIPLSSQFLPPANVSNGAQGTANRSLRRPLATERATYLVDVWGQHNPGDPEKDFEATRYLAHVVIQASQLLAMASVRIEAGGEWTDQQERQPQRIKAGHRFKFALSFDIPVLDSAVQPAPPLTLGPTVGFSS